MPPDREEAREEPFLGDWAMREVTLSAGPGLSAPRLALGPGPSGLEVVVVRAAATPAAGALRAAWKARNGGRAAPLLLVALHGARASLCGPAGDDPPVFLDRDQGQVERLCREALSQPDRHGALRMLRDAMPSLESDLPGVRNEGLLATHELRHGVPRRPDWEAAGRRARDSLSRRDADLLKALGFSLERHDNATSILRASDRRVAVAVLLHPRESPEGAGDRFGNLSPVSYGLAVADREGLPWVVLVQGQQIRVHPARVGIGVGRRGRTETFVECHGGLLPDDRAAFLWFLCSAEALVPGGTLEQVLAESGRFAGDLAAGLRERIYRSVVPRLAQGLVAAWGLENPSVPQLAETYQMTLWVLFRLLFLAYAEDRDLLPYRFNDLYRRRSLKTLARELADGISAGRLVFGDGDVRWTEFRLLCQAVDRGNPEWGLPAYDGGLFSEDPTESPLGAALAGLSLPDAVFGPALADLLLVQGPEGIGPVDFRSLGVREFGTIYEGLLESDLALAETDLAVDRRTGAYRPCRPGETPEVRRGETYLHNASGARKATGSFFTPSFAVEHLLDHALEPALRDHLARLDALDDDGAGERFFDFRVADLAMGSGHFLVAAADRIERALSGYLARRPLPAVAAELADLRAATTAALGPLADQVSIEDTQLLRRLVARRCLYGVDVNPVAVLLARLSLWIHTFVPGLPLSLLDHGLVCGNALTGIGRLEEVRQAIEEASLPVFSVDAAVLLGEAAEPLRRLGRIADATPSDLARARRARWEALAAVAPAAALCDVVAAARIQGRRLPQEIDTWQAIRERLPGSPEHQEAREVLRDLDPLHFPVAFPEVFLRDRPGFDVILGNPPWEEATVEEDAFLARHDPGLRSLPQREQEARKAALRRDRPDLVAAFRREQARAEALRRALVAGPYPGMGTGDPDLYKAFCWRFWELACEDGGRIGVVLPRSALAAKGSADFRRRVFREAEALDVTMLLNSGGWVFRDAEHRYTIGLVVIERRKARDGLREAPVPVRLRGPYRSLDRFRDGAGREPAAFAGSDVEGWNDTASLPLLPTEESVEVFRRMRRFPRLDLDDRRSWRARPHTELHATNDKPLMDLSSRECPEGFWPVFKGESFDLWTPDTGARYAWADPRVLIEHLQRKRRTGARNRLSPFSEFDRAVLEDAATLPCRHPRIAFRDVTRATDSRTVRVALVPPEVFLSNQAPYLLWPRGSRQDETFLLGILSSLPLDWCARRFVETHLNFFLFNPLPVPRPSPDDPLRVRVIEVAGRLACPDERFARWAREVGVPWGPLPPDEREDLIRELDALAALLYGLEEDHLVHVFETFHEGWDFEDRLRGTLVHFARWKTRRDR